MDFLEFEEKLEIKTTLEKVFYYEKNMKNLKLLKGSIDINKKIFVEDLLKKTKYYYDSGNKDCEALKFYIGKAIIILEKNRKDILEFISLEDFDSGIEEYRRLVGDDEQEQLKKKNIIKENFATLIREFQKLGKFDRLEKGRILDELENILAQNRDLGNKTNTWEMLGISGPDKSMLSKRYTLFKEFQENKNFSGDKDCIKVINEMTDINLKKITKKGISIEEKEEMILSLIK